MNDAIGVARESHCDRENGMVFVRSPHSAAETVARLTGLLRAGRVKLFATIDHAAEARAAGLELRPTVVLVFGNPKAGTPLMVASPGIAIDLPLKILVSEDADGVTWMAYVAAECLASRHGIPASLTEPLGSVERLVGTVSEPSENSGNSEGSRGPLKPLTLP